MADQIPLRPVPRSAQRRVAYYSSAAAAQRHSRIPYLGFVRAPLESFLWTCNKNMGTLVWSLPQLSCVESKGKYSSANSGITTSQTLKKPCIPVETAAKVLMSDTYESVEVK